MTEIILVILIAILSFLSGLFTNYTRWRVSGRIYASAKKTYKENIELKWENKFLKHEVDKNE